MSPGERLPSVLSLERELGVANVTVEAALELLRREGLVVTRPRSGTYVAERSRHDAAIADGSIPGAAFPTANNTLAVFAHGATPFYKDCVDHLIAQAAALGLAIECRYADHGLTLDDVLRFEALHPAGFLMVGFELEWAAAAVIARGHAAVVIGEPDADVVPRVPAAFADAEQGGFLAAQRLLLLGHRRIAYLHRTSAPVLQRKRRWRGHERALREAGLGEAPPRLISDGKAIDAWCANAGAVRDTFTAPDAPTAVVAWSDPAAAMLIAALRRADLSVPGDVSVVGYDNLPIGAHCWPPLDSVDQHIDVLVRHALFLLSAPQPGGTVSSVVTPTLVCRESCAPPRS